MFTDGLVEDRDRDIDTGLALLRSTLAVPGRSAEDTCRAVLDTVLSPRAGDDVCEVADGSSTAPHLRRAEISDEGGRGLFLVAQFADRWETRYLARGKIIWTEQSLTGPAEDQGGVQDDEALLDQWGEDGL